MTVPPPSDWLLLTTTGGLSIGAGIVITRLLGRGIAWLMVFFTGRHDKREEHLDAATREIIEALRDDVRGLRERVSAAETALLECQRKHAETERKNAESEAKVLKLEAMLAGLGDARQHAALIVAAEKQEARK
jgi:Mg2+ and Co2+ transporter CorA